MCRAVKPWRRHKFDVKMHVLKQQLCVYVFAFCAKIATVSRKEAISRWGQLSNCLNLPCKLWVHAGRYVVSFTWKILDAKDSYTSTKCHKHTYILSMIPLKHIRIHFVQIVFFFEQQFRCKLEVPPGSTLSQHCQH